MIKLVIIITTIIVTINPINTINIIITITIAVANSTTFDHALGLHAMQMYWVAF